MSAEETLKIISKQWCSIEDLKKISHLGNNNVYKLKKEIQKELEEQGYDSNVWSREKIKDWYRIFIQNKQFTQLV